MKRQGESIAHPEYLAVPDEPLVHLRPIRSADAPEIYKIIGDNPSLRNHIYWMNLVDTPEAAQEYVDNRVDDMAHGKGVQFLIIPGAPTDDGPIGGSIGIHKLKERGEGFSSCWLTEDLQGKGYGRRSAEVALTYAAAALSLRTIKLDIEKGNERSQKVARLLGFVHRGSFRDDLGELAGDGERHRVLQVWQKDCPC